jgi:hypothetical protein
MLAVAIDDGLRERQSLVEGRIWVVLDHCVRIDIPDRTEVAAL